MIPGKYILVCANTGSRRKRRTIQTPTLQKTMKTMKTRKKTRILKKIPMTLQVNS